MKAREERSEPIGFSITSERRKNIPEHRSIEHVDATEYRDAFQRQGLTVSLERALQEFGWYDEVSRQDRTAIVPICVVAPSKPYCSVRRFLLFGEAMNGKYQIEIANGDGMRPFSDGVRFSIGIDCPSKNVSEILVAFHRSIDELCDALEKEKHEERAAEKKLSDEIGYVHPDSFGGTDY